MTNIYYIPTAAFFLATFGCASLALAIYRRAARDSEVRVLLLMLLLFSLYSFVLFCNVLSFGVLKTLQEQTYQIVAAAALAIQILFFASVGHFLVLTHRRVLGENGVLSDPLSPYWGYGKSWLYWSNIAIFYVFALAIIGKSLHRILQSLQANPDGQLVLPGTAPHGMSAVRLFIFMLIFLVPQITLNAYRATAGSKTQRFIGYLTRPFFRTLPQPDNILRLSDTPRDPIPSRRLVWPDRPISWLPQKAQPFFRDAPMPPVPIGKDEWRAVQALILWALTSVIVGFWIQNPFRPDQPSSMTWYLLPALFVAALVYYKMRFVFFDVLIKRGLIIGIFLLSSALYSGMLLAPVQSFVERASAPASPLTLYAGSILFMICWMAFYGRLDGLLDRHLFRRTDYRKAASEIGELMKQFVEPQALLGAVTERLRGAVNADAVRFIPGEHPGDGEPSSDPTFLAPVQRQLSTVRIPLSASEKIFGHLEFGKRLGGFRYQSEDLAFVTTVARQLAGMLHNFELRSEREAQRQREQELRALATQSELRALRAQINPHFLFNALNSLADLTQEDPGAAESAVLNLSHVFRYALEASQHEYVPLGEELDFLRSYLAVESLRFEDRLHCEISASADARTRRIPPMLIQPVVENAVKHGVSGKIDGGLVQVSAILENETLHIEVSDNGPGINPDARMGQGDRGIGLMNVRARLEHLAGAGSLQIDSPPGGGTRVSFDLPALRDPGGQDSTQ